MIRCALNRWVSRASNARSPDIFGLFFTSEDTFEVAEHVINRQYSDMDLSLIHASFGENR